MLEKRYWAPALTCALFLNHCGTSSEDARSTRDSSAMLLVSEGEFHMGGKPEDLAGFPPGNSADYLAERPLHRVRLSSFYLDEHEVTVGQYRNFLDYLAAAGDTTVNHIDQPATVDHAHVRMDSSSRANEPVLGATWYSAYAYCSWAGKRLPTEAEWEYAARGRDGVYRKYPWGNNAPFDDGVWYANLRPRRGADTDGHRRAAPVGSFPDGVSYFGVLDLAGNASEWVSDWYSDDYYHTSHGARDPQGPASGDVRVVKGGSYQTHRYNIRIASRRYGDPRKGSRYRGFRCARGVSE